jgi:hypothetical protein
VIENLVLEARRDYELDTNYCVHTYRADMLGSSLCVIGTSHTFYSNSESWRWNREHPKRHMSSIILPSHLKDTVLDDCKEFLGSETWGAFCLIVPAWHLKFLF